MLRSLLALPLAFLLAAGGCNGSQSSVSANVETAATGEPFLLGLGETVEVGGHSLQFVDVVEDSRCPSDVDCVWEGRAKVQLAASSPDTDEGRQVLTLPYASMTDDESDSWSVGGLKVRVHDLVPYPRADGPPAEEPQVRLSVSAEG